MVSPWPWLSPEASAGATTRLDRQIAAVVEAPELRGLDGAAPGRRSAAQAWWVKRFEYGNWEHLYTVS